MAISVDAPIFDAGLSIADSFSPGGVQRGQ